MNLLPNPSIEILNRIRDLHSQRKGQKPFEADYALLDKIKVLISLIMTHMAHNQYKQGIETYGAKLVDCRDIHGSSCRLSPSPRGILVFQQLALIQTWEV